MINLMTIEAIKLMIGHFGNLTTGDLEIESSPCIACAGDACQLVERFNENTATVVSYVGSEVTSENEISYEDLPEDVIEEVYFLLFGHLRDTVVEKIKSDIAEGDETAIDELLMFTPLVNLIGFLPENLSKQ